MNTNSWISILGIVVSLLSVYFSNILGRKATVAALGNEQKLKRYQEFYIPFIKRLYFLKPSCWNFFDLRDSINKDGTSVYGEFSDLMFEKMEYMSPDVPPLVTQLELTAEKTYSDVHLALSSKFDKAPSLEEAAKRTEIANKLFDDIVIKTLQEATQVAKSLSLEPISEPLLNSYLEERDHRKQFLARLQEAQKSGIPLASIH